MAVEQEGEAGGERSCRSIESASLKRLLRGTLAWSSEWLGWLLIGMSAHVLCLCTGSNDCSLIAAEFA